MESEGLRAWGARNAFILETTERMSMTDPVMRAQYRWRLLEELLEDLAVRRRRRTPRARSLPRSLQDTRDGSSFGSVERGLPGRERRPYRSARNASIEKPRRRAPVLAAW